jgi:hypothetical protein
MTLVDGRVFFDRNTAPTLENTIERLQQRRTRPRVTSDAGGGK